MNASENRSKFALASSMVIFGTIGIFRRYISLSSSVIAFVRGVIGTLFLIGFILVAKKKFSWQAVRKNLVSLLISGFLVGFNWILLFESYQYTTVATATLCYYMAPIFVILASPFFLKEKLTGKKFICIAVALMGMVLVSGVPGTGFRGISEMKGILLGLGAASLYAAIIILNQKIHNISAYDKTIIQLGTASVVLVPYILLTEDLSGMTFHPLFVCMLLIVGIVHTGIAYALYFGSMDGVKAQTVALLGYIDPIVAILLSAIFLHERMGVAEMIGTALVLGATIVGELTDTKK